MTKINFETLERNYPQIFNQSKKETLSKFYIHVSTSTIVKDLENLGWDVFSVKTVKTKKSKLEYTKHLVQLFNKDIKLNDGNFPTILLTNSHDGSTSVKFEVGIFRLVCSNGLVIKTKDFGTFKTRHRNYSFEILKENIIELTNNIPNLIKLVEKFEQKLMTSQEIHEFARKALLTRLESDKSINNDLLKDFIQPKRNEDKEDNLWNIFNRFQERLTWGEFSYNHTNKKKETVIRKARPIKSFSLDMEMNKKLWEIAENYC